MSLTEVDISVEYNNVMYSGIRRFRIGFIKVFFAQRINNTAQIETLIYVTFNTLIL